MGKKTVDGQKARWTKRERNAAAYQREQDLRDRRRGMRPDWLVALDGNQHQYIKGDNAIFPRRNMTVKERRMNTRTRYQRKMDKPRHLGTRYAPPDYEHYVSPDVLSGIDSGK